MFQFHTLNVNKQKGYSLVELVVVLAVFLIISGVTINIFISIVQNQKRVLEEQELLNQASYAMEYMSNALRLAPKDSAGSCVGIAGAIYVLTHCPVSCNTPQPCPCNGVKFINSLDSNTCDEFFLDTSVVNKPQLQELKNGVAQNLLSKKLNLKYGNFVVNGNKVSHSASANDSVQPRVTMLLDVLTESSQSEKVLQTTVSQRNFGLTAGSGFNCTLSAPYQCIQGGGGASCIVDGQCGGGGGGGGPICGDLVCTSPENALTCPADCTPPPPPICGDLVCTPPETSFTCLIDCP